MSAAMGPSVMLKWTLVSIGSVVGLLLGFAAYLILPPLSFLSSTEAKSDPDHDTQIVVQWMIDDEPGFKPGSGTSSIVNAVRFALSLKRLEDLEGTLLSEAHGAYRDTGNDISAGTFNVYLYAAEPDRAVNRVIALYRAGELRPGMRIAIAHYKNALRTDWDYQLVYPVKGGAFDLMRHPTTPLAKDPRTAPSTGSVPQKTG